MEKWWTKVEDVAEKVGFNATGSYEGDDWNFAIGSPAGQDCHIEIFGRSIKNLADNLWAYVDSYDVSEETYVWLDNTGHGKNGAPYDMADVYNDMAWFRDKAEELWEAINELVKETE